MGILDNDTVIVDAILTKLGRQKLANGQPLKINTNNSYPMVAYFTEKSGNSLRIYN